MKNDATVDAQALAPTTAEAATVDRWLRSFESALRARNIDALVGLFVPDSH